MTELIVDGKNVLEPVNFEKNKNEIMQQRASVPSQVSLTHFKENIGLFRANVKGDDLNGLVGQLQTCFSEINQRETKVYDELDTIFNTVESIHKGSIEGIVLGVKSAQEAIKQSDYAIEQIKTTLVILQDFKKRLEENTKHLNDIDIIWDATQRLSKDCSKLEEALSKKSNKFADDIRILTEFKENVEKSKHIKDIDKMFDDLTSLKIELKQSEKLNSEKYDNIEKNIDKLISFQKKTEEIHHLYDVDQMWTDFSNTKDKLERTEQFFTQNIIAFNEQKAKYDKLNKDFEKRVSELEDYKTELMKSIHLSDVDSVYDSLNLLIERVDYIEKELVNTNEVEKEIVILKNSLKNLYFILGGMVFVVILQIILNVMGVL